MTVPNITLSPNAVALVAVIAAKHGVSPSAYIESLVMTVAVPEILEDLGQPSPLFVTEAAPPPKAKKKKKKAKKKKEDGRSRKVWSCPTCGKRTAKTGARVHFVSCGLKHRVPIVDLAEFAMNDTVLASSFKLSGKTGPEVEGILYEVAERWGHTWGGIKEMNDAAERLDEIRRKNHRRLG